MFSLINFDSCNQRMMTWQSFEGFHFALLILGGVSSTTEEQLAEAGGVAGVTTAALERACIVLGISSM
jgi:hypothetical protein